MTVIEVDETSQLYVTASLSDQMIVRNPAEGGKLRLFNSIGPRRTKAEKYASARICVAWAAWFAASMRI